MKFSRPRRTHAARAVGIAVSLGIAFPLTAQERGPDRIVPTNAVVITGYATVGQSYQPEGGLPSAFMSTVSPVFLFQFQDKLLFETELEFELEDGATATSLEYAQADIMVSDRVTVVAGKFLLPFGIFGERIHPTWINKLATMPPIYGHGENGFGAAPLMAIPSDVGVMARATLQAGRWHIGLNAYMSNGFQVEEGGHGEEEATSAQSAFRATRPATVPEVPKVELIGTSGDNTNNKMVGGRVDLFLPPFVEVNLSGFTGKYDADDRLSMKGLNVAGEMRRWGFEARGEFLATWQDFETPGQGISRLKRSGLYSQLTYRMGPWEPVVRFSKIFDDEFGNVTELSAASQTALGIDYWITPSVAVMTSYEFNREDAFTLDNDRFNLHLAFGF
jgi:hypothetical protein